MTTEDGAAPRLDVADAARPVHFWRWVLAAILLVLLAQLVVMMLTNPAFQWRVVLSWLTAESVGKGIAVTLLLTLIAMVVGVVLGVLLAAARLSANPVLRWFSALYIWVFRGVPTLVQLIVWFNLSALTPTISLGIPFWPQFVTWHTNSVITPMLAAVLGLGLSEGAYMAEIVRSGLLSVDSGQTEAGRAIGMSRLQVFFRITLPQAMPAIIPPTGNQVINMAKGTSLVSVIALSDLLYSVQSVYNRTFQTIPLLMVAVIWYLVITSVLYVFQSMLENHYSHGSHPAKRGFWDSLRIHPKADRVNRTPSPAPDEVEAETEVRS
jgi:polar amino acid transport system permease protein